MVQDCTGLSVLIHIATAIPDLLSLYVNFARGPIVSPASVIVVIAAHIYMQDMTPRVIYQLYCWRALQLALLVSTDISKPCSSSILLFYLAYAIIRKPGAHDH